jgi:hypothetical protein
MTSSQACEQRKRPSASSLRCAHSSGYDSPCLTEIRDSKKEIESVRDPFLRITQRNQLRLNAFDIVLIGQYPKRNHTIKGHCSTCSTWSKRYERTRSLPICDAYNYMDLAAGAYIPSTNEISFWTLPVPRWASRICHSSREPPCIDFRLGVPQPPVAAIMLGE